MWPRKYLQICISARPPRKCAAMINRPQYTYSSQFHSGCAIAGEKLSWAILRQFVSSYAATSRNWPLLLGDFLSLYMCSEGKRARFNRIAMESRAIHEVIHIPIPLEIRGAILILIYGKNSTSRCLSTALYRQSRKRLIHCFLYVDTKRNFRVCASCNKRKWLIDWGGKTRGVGDEFERLLPASQLNVQASGILK